MQQTDDKLTGTALSQAGSEKRLTMARLEQERNPAVLRAALQPPSTSDHRQQVRAAIVGPLSAMTTFAMMPENDRKEAGRFWLDALEPYRVDEIQRAFLAFARKGGGYPNPQSIIGLIQEDRAKIGRRIAELEREREAVASSPRPKPAVDPAKVDAILKGSVT